MDVTIRLNTPKEEETSAPNLSQPRRVISDKPPEGAHPRDILCMNAGS